MKYIYSFRIKNVFLILMLIIISANSFGQKRPTISGYIQDKTNGEALIGATVYIKELKAACSSNVYGFYSISATPGKYTFLFSYVGYKTLESVLDLNTNTTFNAYLDTNQVQIKEVVISTDKPNTNITDNNTGMFKIDAKSINSIPLLYGERDVIKAIQMTPGVTMPSEGSSGFVVRGGNIDQNLILLDEATVYNPSHLMGMFSSFNNDAIKDVKLYKGDIPAAYGGRLASLLDVRMKEGNNQKYTGNAGIGMISSHLTFEGPIIKNKSSFIVSGRRTYADMFFPLFKDTNLQKTILYFYDLNMKVNSEINQNNRIFLSGYFGNDVYGYSDQQRFSWGNKTSTIRWNHLFSSKLFANVTLLYSDYNYDIQVKDSTDQLKWLANLSDYTFKTDFTWYLNTKNTLRFGISETYHEIQPGKFTTTFLKTAFQIPVTHSLEGGFYASNDQKITDKLSLEYGIRFSLFQNLGKATIFKYNENEEITDSAKYGKGKIFKSYPGFEPRFTATYLLGNTSSIKVSYDRMVQYLQQATNSLSGSPLDVWFTSSPNVKPQVCDQVAVGYFKNLAKKGLELSAEIYYKNIQHQIDFKDNAQLLINNRLESQLRFGKAWAYGAELMIRKTTGNINGWISYNWSKTERKINGINNGKIYNSNYDKPHQFNIVISYNLSDRTSLSSNWIYSTGAPATLPSGKYYIGATALPYYTSRNAARLPDYHRMDIAITRKGKQHKYFLSEWNLTIFNLYNRRNPFYYSFEQDNKDPNLIRTYQNSLLPIIPTITWNIKF